MADIKYLISTLKELSIDHPDYPGTVELDGLGCPPKLRYYANPMEELVESKRLEWNRSVRDLESISKEVTEFLQSAGETIEDCETNGATVMRWVLAKNKTTKAHFQSSQRTVGNAFKAIAIELGRIDQQIPKKTDVDENGKGDSSTDKPKRGRWLYEAMLIKKDEPNITDKDLAGRLGISPSSLSKSTKYQSLKETFTNDIEKGTKYDGKIESTGRRKTRIDD